MPPISMPDQNEEIVNLSENGETNSQPQNSDSDDEYLPDLETDEDEDDDSNTLRENSPIPGPSNINVSTSQPPTVQNRLSSVPRRRPPRIAGTADQPIDLDSGDDDIDYTHRPRPNTKITITAANDRIEIQQFYGVFQSNVSRD